MNQYTHHYPTEQDGEPSDCCTIPQLPEHSFEISCRTVSVATGKLVGSQKWKTKSKDTPLARHRTSNQ